MEDEDKAVEASSMHRGIDPNEGDISGLPRVPLMLETADRLKTENLNLKLVNSTNRETILQHQITELHRQMQDVRQERATYTEQAVALRAELEKKYGFSFSTHQLDLESGIIRPRGNVGVLNSQAPKQED